MVQGSLTVIKWLLFLGTPHLYVTDSFGQHLNASHLPGVEFLIRIKVIYYQIMYKFLYNTLWRIMIWKLLGSSPFITTSHQTRKNHSNSFSCEPAVRQNHGRLPTYKQLHAAVGCWPTPNFRWAEVYQTPPPTLVSGFHIVVSTSVVNGLAFWGFSKEFLGSESPNNICRRWPYCNTWWLSLLSQCCITHILIPQYVKSRLFPSLQLSVRWQSCSFGHLTNHKSQ